MIGRVGIGYRKEFGEEFFDKKTIHPDFVELAPENWMGIGGYWKKILDKIAGSYPITCHGLSLSIGSPEEIDMDFLRKVKQFLKTYEVKIYSEHLSYSKFDNAHLYDLLPIPFTEDAIKHVVKRIEQVQDFLERKIVIENVSYYTPVAAEIEEAEFIDAIISEAGCELLLDVNNVYVNAHNHRYNAKEFIDKMPLDKVSYIHMAGHYQINEDVIIDTHGESIIDPVYELFEWTIDRMHPVPVLLERDFNIPDLHDLQHEMNRLQDICNSKWKKFYVAEK